MHRIGRQQQKLRGTWKVHAEVQGGDQSEHKCARSLWVWLQARYALKLCLLRNTQPGSSIFI